MRRKAVRRDINTRRFANSAGDHPPPNKTLYSAERDQEQQSSSKRPAQPFLRPEPHKTRNCDQANQAAKQAVSPLPPKDIFKLAERHSGVLKPIFGGFFVLIEELCPGCIRKRRQ